MNITRFNLGMQLIVTVNKLVKRKSSGSTVAHLFFFSVTMCVVQLLCQHQWEFSENTRLKSQIKARKQTAVCHCLVGLQRIHNVKLS